MKEIKILLVLVFFTGVTYWGIEPLAHSIFFPKVSDPDYSFSDLEEVKFNDKASVEAGKVVFQNNCASCHSLKADNIPLPVTEDVILPEYGTRGLAQYGFERLANEYLASLYGVVPPDLSNTGSIYDKKFLINFIKNPEHASFNSAYKHYKQSVLAKNKTKAPEVEHEALQKAFDKDLQAYIDKTPKISMPGLDYLTPEEMDQLIAYLVSTAKTDLSPKQVTVESCVRCHSIKYVGIAALTPEADLKKYLGTAAPDLSQVIRSKGADYLHKFINNPQKMLPGTSMLRVGVNEASQAQIVSYLETVGDPKKAERNELGKYVLGFLVIFTFFAYLWKVGVFREVH